MSGIRQIQRELTVRTPGRGLHEITAEISAVVSEAGIRTGLCCVFMTHTSASLLIQENADPSARRDIESFLDRLAPEDDPTYTHTAEGPDDMPAHLRATLTRTTETVPIQGGRLALGTWQGLFLCEHRFRPHRRSLFLHLIGE